MNANRHLPLLCLLFLLGVCQATYGSFLTPKIDSIQVIFDDQQLILPGESFRIGVISWYRNGKVKKTVGMDGGSVWWWRYKVEVSGGTASGGRISVNEQLVPARGKYIDLKVYPRRKPELTKELLLPLNYETKITYQPLNNFDKSPGSQIKGEIISEFNNGQTRICKDLRNSRESAFFNFSTSGGDWNNGRFTIDSDFRRIDNHRATLTVNSLRNTLVADTFAVVLDYKHKYKLTLYGNQGSPGFSGMSGSSGIAGSHGYDGQPGQHGEFGSDGPDIGVWVDLYRDSLLNQDLLYVFAQNNWTKEEYRYLINPEGGSLSVSSQGGAGGSGGIGGPGGSGCDGADGNKWIETHKEKRIVKKPVVKKVVKKEKKKVTDKDGKETEIEVDVEVEETVYIDEEIEVVVEVIKQGPGSDGTDGGDGGPGGLGGVGGYGGNITLYLTDDAWPYQRLFTARSDGGSGGMHGSGGIGGRGGSGGQGNPNGHNGRSGSSGPSAMGWADSGRSGKISVEPTEEFFFYVPKSEVQGK